jgi:DNA ligase (NAD+)
MNIPGIGEKVATSLCDYFLNKEHRDEIELLQKNGLHIIKKVMTGSEDHPLYNKTVVLTGTLQSFSRHEAEKKILSVGGRTSDTVSKKVDYLVVGEDAGSKLEKAKKLNVKILTEDEFLELFK